MSGRAGQRSIGENRTFAAITGSEGTTMTDTRIETRDILALPFDQALTAARSAGLLPAHPDEKPFVADAGQTQPVLGALTTLTPRLTFTANGSLFLTRPDMFRTAVSPIVGLANTPNVFDGVLWNDFRGLAAGQHLVVWLKIRAYGSGTLSIGGTGNPSTVVVSNPGATTLIDVPFALTASNSGTAILFVVPTLTGMGGEWASSTLYAV